MNLEESFNEAVKYVNSNINNIPINDNEKLDFYKYYKQATIGDININKPSIFELQKKMKYDAWLSVKGMSREDAYRNYINLVTYIKYK
jgi:acyl-CoA-binding protein